MTTTSFDFSAKPELLSLAHVVRDLQAAAGPMGIDFFLMGAMARDLMLTYAWGVETGRQTRDVDFSVMVGGWPAFLALRQALIDGGSFGGRPRLAAHQLRHASTGLPLDIVPFGAIENADRTIAWPPEQHTVFDCFGMREAFGGCLPVRLPEDVTVRVAAIPALALLKIAAWKDRHRQMPGKDAGDLVLYLRHYIDCGNMDHATQAHADLFEVDHYDHEATSARLLGRDMVALLERSSITRVLDILLPEADSQGRLTLADQSGRDLEQTRALIEALCGGLKDAQTDVL